MYLNEFRKSLVGRKLFVHVLVYGENMAGIYVHVNKVRFLAKCVDTPNQIDARIVGREVYVG